MNSDRPQEIEANKEIVFTYDVNFEVVLIVLLVETIPVIEIQEYYGPFFHCKASDFLTFFFVHMLSHVGKWYQEGITLGHSP